MEFLDDLLNRPESEDAQEDRQPGRQAGDKDATRQPAPPPTLPGRDEAAWADLLESVDLDEVQDVAPANDRRRRRSGGLSTGQTATLGVLGLVVIGLWIVIMALVGRSFSNRGLSSTSGAEQGIAASEAEPLEAAPTSAESDLTAGPSPTSGPPVTPSPTPPIVTAFDSDIQENPDDVELYLQRGRQYTELGAYQAALTDFERAQELDPERVEAYIGEGWASFDSGRLRRAEEAFKTAISLHEAVGEAHFGLGAVTFYQGDYEAAAKAFDAAAEIDPTHAEAEAWLGIASAKLNDEPEAFGAVTRAMSQTKELALNYVAQSWAQRIETPPDIDGAQADLLYARELAPNSFLTLNALAEFYVNHRPERLVEAEQLAAYAEDWAANDIERAVALQTLGKVYLAQNRKVDAEREFIRAIDLVTKEGDILLAGLEEDLNRARE